MALIKNFLYPPIVDTVMDTFIRNTPCRIYFDINDFNSASDISGIQVVAYQQDNNQYALDATQFPRHIASCAFQKEKYDGVKQLYYIDLQPALFAASVNSEAFPNNTYFRVQLRFINSNSGINISSTNFINLDTIDNYSGAFSEWSTVTLIRGIDKPKIVLDGHEEDDNSSTYSYSSFTALSGRLTWISVEDGSDVDDNLNYDTLQEYNLKLFEKDSSGLRILLADSGTLYPSVVDASKNQFYWHIPIKLDSQNEYEIQIDYRTTGGYTVSNEVINTFNIIEPAQDTDIQTLTIQSYINNEEGYVGIQITGDWKDTMQTKNFCIIRMSSEDNFNEYEDLKYFTLTKEDNNKVNFYFRDFLVKSGVFYRYGIQTINSAGVRSAAKWTPDDTDQLTSDGLKLIPDLEHIFLYNGGKQLKISFNKSVGDFKHVVKESLTETLGSQFPYARRNSNVNYRQFSISGLISYQEDEEHLLASLDELQRLVAVPDKVEDPKYYLEKENVVKSYPYDWSEQQAVLIGAESIKNEEEIDYNYNYMDANDSYNSKRPYHNQEVNSFSALTDEDGNPIEHIKKYKGSDLRKNKQLIAQAYKDYNSAVGRTELYDFNLERDFREKVMEFLYDNTVKLYKSAAEGNILVKLTEISFTPNQELGGRVYDFSATATEIDKYSLQNCVGNGVYSIGRVVPTLNTTYSTIKGTVINQQNIYQAICNKHNYNQPELNSGSFSTSTEVDRVSWFRLQFNGEPYFVSIEQDTISKSDEPTGLYGYGFYLTCSSGSGGDKKVPIFVNRSGVFNVSDYIAPSENSTVGNIYETTIFNVYIENQSLYDYCYSQLTLEDQYLVLDQEALSQTAEKNANEILATLDVNEDVCVLGIEVLDQDADNVTCEYIAKAHEKTYSLQLSATKTSVLLKQLHNPVPCNENLVTLIKQFAQASTQESAQSITVTEVSDIFHVNLEAPEHTVIEVATEGNSTLESMMVSDTGILNLQDDDTKITNLTIKGIHFTRVTGTQNVGIHNFATVADMSTAAGVYEDNVVYFDGDTYKVYYHQELCTCANCIFDEEDGQLLSFNAQPETVNIILNCFITLKQESYRKTE